MKINLSSCTLTQKKFLDPWPLIFWLAGKLFSKLHSLPFTSHEMKPETVKIFVSRFICRVFFFYPKKYLLQKLIYSWASIKPAPSIKVLNIQWPPLISDRDHLFAIPMTVFPLVSWGHQALDRLSLALV